MSSCRDFQIENGILTRYTGAGGDVVIPDDVLVIGDETFSDCVNLTGIKIPDRVIHIGEMSFQNCINLTRITIPDRVTCIGDHAFRGCRKLISINIPRRVVRIGMGMFGGCTNLTNITLPDRVTYIGDSVFWGCKSLTSITIPDRANSIGDEAFGICESLTNIAIPDSVTSIGAGAFLHCTSLTSIVIPNSVTSIGKSAFSGCASLTDITIPKSVRSIGQKAFYGCKSIKLAAPNGRAFMIRCYDNMEKDIVAAMQMLRMKKIDTRAKMSPSLKFALALMLFDFYDDTDARAYLKRNLAKGMKALIDDGNLELVEILLKKTDLVTKCNIDKCIQYAIDTRQQEIYLTLIHYKNAIGAYAEISEKFWL